jgi:hypothetical protein
MNWQNEEKWSRLLCQNKMRETMLNKSKKKLLRKNGLQNEGCEE